MPEHGLIIHCLEASEMAAVANVYDHCGVWIGTVDQARDVCNHTGVRIGTADERGDVYDHTHVRIGHIMLP
jgi:hypothetical protein